jgi:serine/threonine protein kinase
MSPEQLRGGEKITAASDIYSMGVVAFEMITGRRPFNASSGPQLLELQREGVRLNPADLRPNLSPEARAILLRALAFDPSARYENAAEFCNQLARALTDSEPPIEIKPPRPWSRIRKFVIGGLLILLVGIGVAIYLNNQRRISLDNQNAAEPTAPSHSFTYWLEVQRMRGNKPYKEPYPSSGKDPVETGDKFRLNVSSPDAGFLYVFNEGQPSPSGTNFTILYPTPSTNQGSASLGANHQVRTNSNTFAGEPGSENVWIVWSISQISELETAKAEAFKHPVGGLTGDTLTAVKNFLTTKRDEVKTKYTTDKDTQQVTVHGNGDVLVKMVELQHR